MEYTLCMHINILINHTACHVCMCVQTMCACVGGTDEDFGREVGRCDVFLEVYLGYRI